jgi:hypothetical protein
VNALNNPEFISKKTRNEFREYFVDNSVLRRIEQEFDSADIELNADHVPNCLGERRTLVERYYASLDLTKWADARKLLKVYENVLTTLADRMKSEDFLDTPGQGYQKQLFQSLCKWLRKDGFVFNEGHLVSVTGVQSSAVVKEISVEFNAQHIADQVVRMEQAIDRNDCWLAIGTAKELVETACKTILSELGVSFGGNADLMDLYKLVRKELKLLPEDISDAAKASATIKNILSNLATIVQGVSELRNPYGTGHGPEGRAKGLESRHAKLAVGAATTLVIFLFDTYKQRNKK